MSPVRIRELVHTALMLACLLSLMNTYIIGSYSFGAQLSIGPTGLISARTHLAYV